MSTKVLSTAIAVPDHHYKIDEIIPWVEKWLSGADEMLKRKVVKIYKGAGINERSSVIPIEKIFSPMSVKEKNDLYIEHAKKLALKALSSALEEKKIPAGEIDFIITTSCTGFMIPSVDAYLVNELKMKQSIQRLPVTEMGCAGGTSALIYANHFLKANPKSKIAVVAVETPTLTLQLDDHSMENFVSTAIFADGASAVILGSEGEGPEILETAMYHFPNAEYLMGFELWNSGLKIVLHKDVPEAIEAHFSNILFPFLEKSGTTLKEIDHFIFHPGGKKILSMVKNILHLEGKNINQSEYIFSKYGNMSSATVLYILDYLLKSGDAKKGDTGLMMAFGPGFMAQNLYLKW